jgi:hypothetical protein
MEFSAQKPTLQDMKKTQHPAGSFRLVPHALLSLLKLCPGCFQSLLVNYLKLTYSLHQLVHTQWA